MKITGAKHFVKALKFEGVDTIFAYPGGYVNDIFDELHYPVSYLHPLYQETWIMV